MEKITKFYLLFCVSLNFTQWIIQNNNNNYNKMHYEFIFIWRYSSFEYAFLLTPFSYVLSITLFLLWIRVLTPFVRVLSWIRIITPFINSRYNAFRFYILMPFHRVLASKICVKTPIISPYYANAHTRKCVCLWIFFFCAVNYI